MKHRTDTLECLCGRVGGRAPATGLSRSLDQAFMPCRRERDPTWRRPVEASDSGRPRFPRFRCPKSKGPKRASPAAFPDFSTRYRRQRHAQDHRPSHQATDQGTGSTNRSTDRLNMHSLEQPRPPKVLAVPRRPVAPGRTGDQSPVFPNSAGEIGESGGGSHRPSSRTGRQLRWVPRCGAMGEMRS